MTVGRLELQARSPRQASEARHMLRRHLDDWGCERVDDAVLVFSELVTNAVQHAAGADHITIVHGAHDLRFEVHDCSHAVPRLRPIGHHVGGLGMHVVTELTTSWGWDQTATGKVVWGEMICCSGVAA